MDFAKSKKENVISTIHPRNELNLLPGNKWMYFTRSVLDADLTESVLKTDLKKGVGFEQRSAHGSNKPPELMKAFIEFFTKDTGVVLDPFSGVGGTLLGASMCNRKAIGIEINEKWVSVYKQVCKEENLIEQFVHTGDCLEEFKNHRNEWSEKFNLILTDPPYGPHLDKTMCNGKYPNCNRISRHNGFSDLEEDFTNSSDLEHYFDRMKQFFEAAIGTLKEFIFGFDHQKLLFERRVCHDQCQPC